MKLDFQLIKNICKSRSISLSTMLYQAGVSRTAFYSLVKQNSLIPKSVHSLADTLEVPVEELIQESPLKKTFRLQKKLEDIIKKNPDISRENIWHTLLLLEEPSINRLDRALIRGRKSVYSKRN